MKRKRIRGSRTHGHGSQKKARGAGGRGGRGFAGAFKHKKLWVQKHHPEHKQKRKFKSLRGKRIAPRLKTINLHQLTTEQDLKGYKVLGSGTAQKGLTIKATAFSQRAKEKIEQAGGKAEEV